jgi:hypothetical protein
MRFRIHFATALLCCGAVIATGRTASAQSQTTSLLRNATAPSPQNASGAGMQGGQASPSPMNSGGQSQEYYPSASGDVSYATSGCSSGACADGYCGCEQSCEAPNCGSGTCGSSGGFCGLCGNGGQFFFTADYLNVRASFSEATAKVVEDLNTGTDTFVPLDFDFESSYRFGGGYRLCCCGEEIRFLFTRMTSSADATAVNGDLVPIEASPPPGGQTLIHANVSANTYDIDWAKTIPLGGCCDSSCCGEACQTGCSGCCRPCCPAWDITWSGGFRWGDVDWGRAYEANDANAFTVTDARSSMNFHGGGLRTGLEGRRYFGKDGWLSLYAKGDLSLLFGRVNVVTRRTTFDPSTPGTPTADNTQTFTNQQIVPVTEIEAGATAQVTCHTALTAGYLMAAWHDLGFRDQDQLNTLLPVSYDDANILGFDGFFARVEFAY